MDTDNIKNYPISSVDKADLGEGELVSDALHEALLERPTSVQAQEFMEQLYTDHKWIGCDCADGAYLAIRKTVNYFCLVRLTKRGEHLADCPFSEANMPIYRTKLAEKIDNHSISFHRAKPKNTGKSIVAPITVKGQQAESSRLARFFFTLYDNAGLNTVDMHGNRPDLGDQYKLIREAANSFSIAGHRGGDILFTHPKAFDEANAYLYEKKWGENQIPQVLLFFTVKAIDGRDLLMEVGGEAFQITSQSKVEYFMHDASPPYNCLITLALRPTSDAPEVLRCAALPIFSNKWLFPVKDNVARHFVKALLKRCKGKPITESKMLIPFFPQLFRDKTVRPDFSIERYGRSQVMIYFLSKTDQAFDARVGEIEYLRSAGINVYVFDMDADRFNLRDEMWDASGDFYDRYFRVVEPVEDDELVAEYPY